MSNPFYQALIFTDHPDELVTPGRSGFNPTYSLDAVVLSPSGHIVLLEVKAGEVCFSAEGISKTYGS